MSSLLYADDMALLASLCQNFLCAIGLFTAECEEAGMEVSSSKPETMVLD